MNERSSYIGIDSTENNEWIVVMCVDGKISFSRPFKNIPIELDALTRFISERCFRPKICLRLSNFAVFELIKYLGSISDAEVMFMSDAGFKIHQYALPNSMAIPYHDNSCQAHLLARCAERLV
jgi:hypothetical protein